MIRKEIIFEGVLKIPETKRFQLITSDNKKMQSKNDFSVLICKVYAYKKL